MRPQKFTFPSDFDRFVNGDSKVVVVSVFGKSQFRAKGCKTKMISSILQVDLLDEPTVDKDLLVDIEGYVDSKEQMVVLHLRGPFDSHTLVQEYDNFIEKLDCKDFLSSWAHLKTKYSRALLMLFHISHVMVLSHPTPHFDYSYIQLFRALENIRLKTASRLTDMLSTIPGISKDWVTNGRPCSPRMLFYFEDCPEAFKIAGSRANIKKLEHALEDKIYQILRKNRIVTNISINSLFAIPANQEFVFMCTDNKNNQDMLARMSRELIKSCMDPSITRMRNLKIDDPDDTSKDHVFSNFLQQHVSLALTKGFDDNVGRHAAPSHFETPNLVQFFNVANKLFQFFVQELDKELSSLHGLLDTDVKFSKSRCAKVLPRALQVYQENLPQHYTRAYHESKMAQAMAVFEMHARGPLFEEFNEKLQEECEKHWRAGRQMCQVLSLTGNPCTNPVHAGGGEGAGGGESLENREDFKDLQVMEHCSGVRHVCACNCGRVQGSREDPFNLKQANYDYYQILSIQCGCNQLDCYPFPVFQPSTHNFRPAQLSARSRKNSLKLSPAQTGGSFADELNAFENENQSPHQSDPIEEFTHRFSNKTTPSPTDENKVVIAVESHDSDNVKEKSLIKQPSTTEYLPTMLNSESPPGLLPRFSSWSLICLGSSSIYSHNIGLQHQSGMLSSSGYLLPWDVTVRLEHQKEKGTLWPASADKGKNLQITNTVKGRKSKRGKELSVKIFVGVEYECPRGHRFMISAPDKVLKVSNVGVKDNANKITSNSNDLALYFTCPCRQSKPLIAQLMRIHIVTPKAPVHVTLNPRVQPGPLPCPIFMPTNDEPIKLTQSAYWILRLPYIYIGEKGPFLPPKEAVSISHGRLLAGMYGICEVDPDKK